MNYTPDISADEALQRLIAGNERFQRAEAHLQGMSRETMAELARGQRPFATILGCSDSRVSPETISDAGLGELFVVRVAGNAFSPEVGGSLQYAGTRLQTPLLAVLGHERSGAIQAALETKCEGIHQRSRIQLLLDRILPALTGLDLQLPPPARLAQAAESNLRGTVRTILGLPEGQARQAEGGMKILGAIYEIETGRVHFLDAGRTSSPERLARKGASL